MTQLKTKDEENKHLIKTLSEDLQVGSRSIAAVKDRCDYIDDYNKRNNLHFVGIEEKPNETWEQSAGKVIRLL